MVEKKATNMSVVGKKNWSCFWLFMYLAAHVLLKKPIF